jgi:hypothetical protein
LSADLARIIFVWQQFGARRMDCKSLNLSHYLSKFLLWGWKRTR